MDGVHVVNIYFMLFRLSGSSANAGNLRQDCNLSHCKYCRQRSRHVAKIMPLNGFPLRLQKHKGFHQKPISEKGFYPGRGLC